MQLVRKITFIFLLFFAFFFFVSKNSYAETLSSASATISTSRPSASSPLSADALTTDGAIKIFNNGSRFLASDSAKIVRTTTGAYINQNILIASQSGDLTIINLGNTMAANAQKGTDVLINPITAMHTISFTVKGSIPVGGSISITYPNAVNTASPSATAFSFNGLTSGNVQMYNSGGVTCGAVTISAPTITCSNLSAKIDAAINPTVTFYIGCSSLGGSACASQIPTMINPTKTAAEGVADTWRVIVNTYNSAGFGGGPIDDVKMLIGIIEAVTIRATVDPTLTFTIVGVANNTLLSTLNTGCSQTDTTNTGIDAQATEVNLGVIGAAPSGAGQPIGNISAQNLTVTTNAPSGYSITATSSGALINPATGFFFASNNSPVAFPVNSNFFGLHPCGIDVDLAKWNKSAGTNCVTETDTAANVCKYAWPTEKTPVLIAQRSIGPVGNTVSPGSGLVLVSYAATQDVSLPPGQYRSVVTYVATPSF